MEYNSVLKREAEHNGELGKKLFLETQKGKIGVVSGTSSDDCTQEEAMKDVNVVPHEQGR